MARSRGVGRATAALAGLIVVMGSVGPAAAAPNGGRSEPAPVIDPAAFTTAVDNPYLPLAPGDRWVYEGRAKHAGERIVVEVTDQTRDVMGVTTIVVRDTVTLDGSVIEDTFDWYAQHRDGTVWYFGEDTKEYEDGEVTTTAGSWEAGVDGAQPGIVMPAQPKVGQAYRQEFYEGEAEDEAVVLAVDGRATVPAGSFREVVVTRDFTSLDPGAVERKYYARGVGFVLEHGKRRADRVVLVEHTQRPA